MIGTVLEERADCIVLAYAGILNIRYDPADNGKKVTAKVAILNPTFVGEKYYLMRAGIRGFTYRYDKWLSDLHQSYIEQVRSGKYELDLCVPPVEAGVQLRATPTEQSPEKAVALVSESDTKALPEDPNAKA